MKYAKYQVNEYYIHLYYKIEQNQVIITEININNDNQDMQVNEKNQTTDQLYRLIKRYFCGEKVDFDTINIDMNKAKDSFAYKVYTYIKTIPYGEVRSYKQIGEAIDSKAYQAIGKICATNKLFLLIPCHRIIYQNGEIGEYKWGKELKGKMLMMERKNK